MLEKLTPEQQALMPVVRDEWINKALGGDNTVDRERAIKGIKFVYSLAKLEEPKMVFIVQSPLGAQLLANVLPELLPKIRKDLDKIGPSVSDSVSDSVLDSIRDSVRDSVRASVLDSVCASVLDSVSASVSASVRDSVLASIRASIRDSVWDSVWASIRASIRDSVWDSVWASVWASVLDSIRDSVSDSVGDSIWDSVRASVAEYKRFDLNGYGYDSGWLAFYDFFRRINVLSDEKFNQYVDFVESGIWDCISFQNVSILVARPTKIIKDSRGMLHNTNGPSVEWGDGYKNYFQHGVRLPYWVIEEPEKITAEIAMKESNAEVRRCMIEKMGQQKFIKQANPQVLDTDKDVSGMARRLMKIELSDDEPMVVVEVNCPSTNHQYMLRVPPDTKTCSEAVAWSYGFKAEDYAPLVES